MLTRLHSPHSSRANSGPCEDHGDHKPHSEAHEVPYVKVHEMQPNKAYGEAQGRDEAHITVGVTNKGLGAGQ